METKQEKGSESRAQDKPVSGTEHPSVSGIELPSVSGTENLSDTLSDNRSSSGAELNPNSGSRPSSPENGTDEIIEMVDFSVGPSSHTIICPHCGESVKSELEYKPTLWTFIISALLCPILCCCMPCLCGCFINIEHTCPKCNKIVGIYRRKFLSDESFELPDKNSS